MEVREIIRGQEPIDEGFRIVVEGGVRYKGEGDQAEVVGAKSSSHNYENDYNPLVHSQEVYRSTREEKEDRIVEGSQEGADDCSNLQLLERHKPCVALARSKETHGWVCTASVLREPAFTNNCTESGAETGEEAGKPKAINRDRRIGGSLGNSWVGYVCQLWVTAIQ